MICERRITLELTNLINTVLCGLILVLGLMGKCAQTTLIGISFGIFGVSHVMEMMGMASGMETLLISMRVLAYVLVAFAMLKALKK